MTDIDQQLLSSTRSTIGFLKDQLSKPPSDSKKFIMASVGLVGVIAMFGTAMASIVLWPSIAAQAQGLAQIALTAWGAIISLYLGLQGGVEYKTTSAIQTAMEGPKKNGTN